jgi:hypothetical protein
MTRLRSKHRSFSITSSLLLLALCVSLPAAAGEVSLRAFTASYDLYKGDMHVGNAELSLEPFDQLWRWRLSTQARGIYAVFVHKKPYSETTFTRDANDVRLRQIVIRDEKNEEAKEIASFDWQAGYMKSTREGKHREAVLSAEVYDYQSIHLLAATMQMQQSQEESVDFYRKGKLTRSKLTYLGEKTVSIGDREIEARSFRQTVEGSRTVIRYFYDLDQPLLPLLIENRKGDDTPSILSLREVDWGL